MRKPPEGDSPSRLENTRILSHAGDLDWCKSVKSVPARREVKRIRATFTNPVERGWESAGGFVKSAKTRQICENPRSVEGFGWCGD